MISVVCVYDRLELFDKHLRASLESQDTEHELIAIDNCHAQYDSAAKALNSGGRRARGDFVMFAHQDVSLLSRVFLKEAERMLNQVRDLGVAGLAGKSKRGRVMTHLTQGEPPRPAGDSSFTDVLEVQTVDECLIFIPRVVFNSLEFDESVCDGWHLYAVDYALSARERGLRTVVLPLAGYHRSPGYSMTKDYYGTLRKVIVKHRLHQKRIFTSMGDWNTWEPVVSQRFRNELRTRRYRAVGMLSRCLRGRT